MIPLKTDPKRTSLRTLMYVRGKYVDFRRTQRRAGFEGMLVLSKLTGGTPVKSDGVPAKQGAPFKESNKVVREEKE